MLLPQRELLVEYWLSNRGAGVCADLGTRVTVQEQHRKGAAWGELVVEWGGVEVGANDISSGREIVLGPKSREGKR
jgi:hypothetical protein